MPTARTVQLNYISDIHLEWLFDKRGLLQTDVLDAIYRPLFRCNRQPATQHNLLMIAGDLAEARKFHYFVPFLESVIADNGFDRVFYVMGNHEYYSDALHKVVGRIQAALDGSPILKAHMSILHNQCATLDNGRVQIIGAPFWYQVAHGDEYAVAQRLSDYRYIKVKRGNHYAKLLYRDVLAAHYQSVCFIEETLRASPSGVQNILFTHHPTSRLFGDADLGYGTVLPARWAEDAEIGLPEKLAACIHGHAHQHLPVHYANEYGIPTVSNTIGYYQEEFKPDSPAGQQQIKDGLPFLMV